MNLPTKDEINVSNSLDEQWACKMFLGKTLEEAEVMFREDFLNRQEDLMWMGPIAFQFYVQGAIRYLQSPASSGDCDAASCFIGLLEYRLDRASKSVHPVKTELLNACDYIIQHYGQFRVDVEVYGDLRPRYRETISKLLQNQ